jgi:hypothetical protein
MATDESLDKALMKLEGMECPEGVDEELWGELKGALEEALKDSCRAGTNIGGAGVSPANHLNHGRDARATIGLPYKRVSTPPTGGENRVRDLDLADHGDGAYTLTWHYRNLGDYDQNGTVGISDITPLAMHYGEDVPDGDPERNSIQAVVDGSGNNIVDIADITPIAMFYGTCCAGYSIRSATSHPESVDETTEIDAASIALAEGDERKSFSMEIVLSPYSFIAVTPVDEEETPGELSNVVMTPNHPPVAQLTAEPTEGDAPLHVTFNAGDSHDVDGPIAKYEWDWEGDGVFDHDSGSVPTAEHTYDVAEVYDPQVRVTDEHSGTDTASLEVWAGRWRITVVVDGLSGPPEHTSLEVVNGSPAISLWCDIGTEPEGYWYVRANDAVGESWGSPVLVQSVMRFSHDYADNALTVAYGHPAVAYYEMDNGELWYARANDADGSSWGLGKMAADIDRVENNLSMAIVDGHPAIAYDRNEVYYIRANEPNGETWGTPIRVNNVDSREISLLVVDGAPAISYQSNPGLHYVRALDADGTAWAEPVTPDSANLAGFRNSLAVVNGNPAIGYVELDNYDLKYVRANDTNGDSWNIPLVLNSEENVGDYCSLAVIRGYPAISYCDATNDSLKYVRATDADGSQWREPKTVDTEGIIYYCSLKEANGYAAISYVNGDQLRFAIYY